jgi:hypothetical protein
MGSEIGSDSCKRVGFGRISLQKNGCNFVMDLGGIQKSVQNFVMTTEKRPDFCIKMC